MSPRISNVSAGLAGLGDDTEGAGVSPGATKLFALIGTWAKQKLQVREMEKQHSTDRVRKEVI